MTFTDQEIMDGNKLIAKLMGWDRTENINSTFFEQSIKHCQYHRSWDWLMPVIDKIESLELGDIILKDRWDNDDIMYDTSVCFVMDGPECYFDLYGTMTKYDEFIVSKHETKILSAWDVVIKFINWYNERK